MIPIIGVSFSIKDMWVPFAITMLPVDSVMTCLFTTVEDSIDVRKPVRVKDQNGEDWVLDCGTLYPLEKGAMVGVWMVEGFDLLIRLNSEIGLSENIYSRANQAALRLEAAKKRKNMVIAAIEEKFSNNRYLMDRLSTYR